MYYISTVFRKTRLIRDIYTYNVRWTFEIGPTSLFRPICAVNCSKQALRTFYMALCRSWGVPGPDTTGSSTSTGCPEELWIQSGLSFKSLRVQGLGCYAFRVQGLNPQP